MGHEEDYNSTNGNKTARGLTSASLLGAPLTSITWRLQGVRGGEQEIDPVRGPLSTGGLYGERAGWSLPGYDDAAGTGDVCRPTTDTPPRASSWYRDDANLNLPKGQDTSVGLTFTDDPTQKYRAEIYVNGWHVGNYVNYLGPQHSFPIPNGILNPNGEQHDRDRGVEPGRQHRRPRHGLADQLRQLRVLAQGGARSTAPATTRPRTRCPRRPV